MVDRYDPAEVTREYERLRLTGIGFIAFAIPLSLIAIGTYGGGTPGAHYLYRAAFGLVALVAAVCCRLVYAALASGRPLAGEDPASGSTAVRVARVAAVLVAIPDSIVALGFVLRYVLGGSYLDYLLFLAVAVLLWAAFFPRRRQFAEWVRLRTEGEWHERPDG